MKEEIFKELLEDTLSLTALLQTAYEQNFSFQRNEFHSLKEKILGHLLAFKEQNMLLSDLFEKTLCKDPELYLLILSAINCISFDDWRAVKCLELLQEKEFSKEEGFSCELFFGIYYSILYKCFENNVQVPYSLKRNLHRKLLYQLEEEIGQTIKIPYKERVDNRILLLTDQLLPSGNHAPTAMVLNQVKLLQDLGYDVAICVLTENYDMKNICIWDYYLDMQYRAKSLEEKYNGFWEVADIGERKLSIFQAEICLNNVKETIQPVFDWILEWKPEFAWYIGGESVLGDLVRNVVPVVGQTCNKGFLCSEVPLLLRWGLDAGEMEEKDYIERNGQKYIEYMSEMAVAIPEFKYHRSDFGFSEKDFIIAIVGTRLESEITEDFLELMKEIQEEIPNITYMIIGDWGNNRKGINRGLRVQKLGYRMDYEEVICIADIFLNPPRQGGGYAAVGALYGNVPVVTLWDCDVAMNTGEKFWCETEREMIMLVKKYATDIDFYKRQIEACKEQSLKLQSINAAEETEKVISFVREEMEG